MRAATAGRRPVSILAAATHAVMMAPFGPAAAVVPAIAPTAIPAIIATSIVVAATIVIAAVGAMIALINLAIVVVSLRVRTGAHAKRRDHQAGGDE
jgi:hypothetical protein